MSVTGISNLTRNHNRAGAIPFVITDGYMKPYSSVLNGITDFLFDVSFVIPPLAIAERNLDCRKRFKHIVVAWQCAAIHHVLEAAVKFSLDRVPQCICVGE